MNRQKYVAFIDILGFKNIIGEFKDPMNLWRELLFNFNASLYAALSNSSVTIDITKDTLLEIKNNEISFWQFSDSIILYTNDDNPKGLEEFIRVLNMFVASSMLRGFPIRGALVKGELFTKPPIIVGQGLVKAATIEAKQAWAGIIVDDSCFTRHDEKEILKAMIVKKMLIETKVPIKKGGKQEGTYLDNVAYEDHVVINWPQFMAMYINPGTSLNSFFERFSGKPEENAQMKIDHTLQFYKDNLGSQRLPSFKHIAELVDIFTLSNTEEVSYEIYQDDVMRPNKK